MQRIRIPTLDAPAAHHLTFICAVAELAHRVLENVTGLQVDLHVGVHQHVNVEREPALTAAAAAAGLRYSEYGGTNWHSWELGGDATCVTIYGKTKPVAPAEPVCACGYLDCLNAALPDGGYCAEHQAAYEMLFSAVTVEPETTAELSQIVTTEFESAALAERWSAADILRREG